MSGISVKKETLNFASFKPLDRWLFNDLAIIFSSRQLRELRHTNLSPEDVPSLSQDEDAPPLHLLVYGFNDYSLDYLELFSKELVAYLGALFSKTIPFDHVVVLVSDKDTKIESIGNILVLNDLELTNLTDSARSLVYISLTVSLFYARIYFGSLVSYSSPEEKFIVEGIRGTLSLIALQTSRVLDAQLALFSDGKVTLEKIVHEKGSTVVSEGYGVILDEGVEPERDSVPKAEVAKKFLNQSLLSYNSREHEEDQHTEVLETNKLLNTYLIDFKYKLFEIEQSRHTRPLYDQNQFYMKKHMDVIPYNNTLAKFKMFYVLKELMIPTHKFIAAFKSIVKSYNYETIAVHVFIQTINDIMEQPHNEDELLSDWFRDNFEKAGINKIEYEIIPQKKKKSRIDTFKLIQTDLSVQNKSNPALRKHNTDILFLNSDLGSVYHVDMIIEDVREEIVPQLADKIIPSALILNASENGYFYGHLSDSTIDFLTKNLGILKDENIRLKLFRHLLLAGQHLDFLDFSPEIIPIETNQILFEFILKNAADLVEANFPSRAYSTFSDNVVNEIEEIKLKFCERILHRILHNAPNEKKGVLPLLITYLPHFICSNVKTTRKVFESLNNFREEVVTSETIGSMLSALFDRYFAFRNVDQSEKHALIKHVAKHCGFEEYFSKADLAKRCDTICERLNQSSSGEFVFDEVFKVILKYDRVITSNDDFRFLIENIKKLCTSRIDENLIYEIFPLNSMIPTHNQSIRLTNDLILDLEEKGMFDYASIIREQLEKMEKMMVTTGLTHDLLNKS